MGRPDRPWSHDDDLSRSLSSRAAELMTRTSSVVTLEVAKQGAIYHGLATLLNQPSPMMQRGEGGLGFHGHSCYPIVL